MICIDFDLVAWTAAWSVDYTYQRQYRSPVCTVREALTSLWGLVRRGRVCQNSRDGA